MPGRKSFWLAGILLAFCISLFGIPADNEAALGALAKEFFTAYANKDLESWKGLWSADAPELASRQQQAQQWLASVEKVEITALSVRQVAVVGDQGRVRVAVGKVNRVLRCVKESGAWKIWQEGPAEDELASALLAAKDEAQRAALLATDPELVTAQLASALIRQGARLYQQGNFPQALEAYRAAQGVAERLGDPIGVADALNHMGDLYSSQNNYGRALELHRKSLALSKASGNKAAIATALNHVGKVYSYQGEYDLAMEYFQKSLALREGLPDKAALGATLKNIGIIHRLRGNYPLALSYYSKVLPLLESAQDESGVAYLLNSIGLLYYYQGNYLRAAEYYRKSLSRLEALGEKEGTGMLSQNLGALYQDQGNYGLARAYYRRAQEVFQALEAKEKVADILVNLGEVDSLEGNWARALQNYRQGLALRESTGDKNAIAYTLNDIGEALFAQGDYTRALEQYEKSLALRQAMGDRPGLTQTLNSVALVHEKQGEYAQALDFAGRAAAIAREIGSSEALWPALTTAARAYRALNQPARARETLAEAVATIESLRSQVAGGEQEQERYFERKISPYRAMVQLLATENQAGEAFRYAERARARVLLDVLRAGRVNVAGAMTTDEQEQERRLAAELVSLNTQLGRERGRSQPDRARVAELGARLERARLELEGFQTNLYAAHPELKGQRGEAQPVAAGQARELLPENSALLEYLVTEQKTYLFVVDKERPEVRAWVIEVRAEDLARQVERFRVRLANRDFAFRDSARRLYDLLLRPAQVQLRGKATLVIVPDGVLWDLPFQALETAAGRYVIEDHALFYAPSATALAEIMRARKRREADARAPTRRGLLAVGNPVLVSQTVERVRMTDERLGPLPEAERQVKRLGLLYGPERSRVYVGAEAREDRFKTEAAGYRVLHLATHGILNDASPMYSHLLLAPGKEEDGLLEAWEILNLELHADLVVLSACETARGRLGAGEGVIGLTWALFVAGAPTTVVSQWKVESRSTTELMLAFHRNLRPTSDGRNSPISRAEALRRAALTLLRSEQYRHPFFWAGFIVVGDGS